VSTAALPTDQAALLASVLAAPEDDGVRLIYADWLDENGEAERAEFIRVQCRLDALAYELMSDEDCGDPNCPGCVEGRALRKRERALIRVHVQDWIPPINGLAIWTHFARGHEPKYGWLRKEAGRGAEEVLAVFRRGFVAHVELTTAAFLGGPCCGYGFPPDVTGIAHKGCIYCDGTGRTPGIAAALFSAQPVTEVRLTDRKPWREPPSGLYFWDRHGERLAPESPEAVIPDALWRLVDGPEHLPGATKRFRTAEAAHAALSAACVRLGRGLAGVG
jgi:uncharacterized protein (TIGR02996 family)